MVTGGMLVPNAHNVGRTTPIPGCRQRAEYRLVDFMLSNLVELGDPPTTRLFSADQPNAPPSLRRALTVIDGCVDSYTKEAGLATAA